MEERSVISNVNETMKDKSSDANVSSPENATLADAQSASSKALVKERIREVQELLNSSKPGSRRGSSESSNRVLECSTAARNSGVFEMARAFSYKIKEKRASTSSADSRRSSTEGEAPVLDEVSEARAAEIRQQIAQEKEALLSKRRGSVLAIATGFGSLKSMGGSTESFQSFPSPLQSDKLARPKLNGVSHTHTSPMSRSDSSFSNEVETAEAVAKEDRAVRVRSIEATFLQPVELDITQHARPSVYIHNDQDEIPKDVMDVQHRLVSTENLYAGSVSSEEALDFDAGENLSDYGTDTDENDAPPARGSEMYARALDKPDIDSFLNNDSDSYQNNEADNETLTVQTVYSRDVADGAVTSEDTADQFKCSEMEKNDSIETVPDSTGISKNVDSLETAEQVDSGLQPENFLDKSATEGDDLAWSNKTSEASKKFEKATSSRLLLLAFDSSSMDSSDDETLRPGGKASLGNSGSMLRANSTSFTGDPSTPLSCSSAEPELESSGKPNMTERQLSWHALDKNNRVPSQRHLVASESSSSLASASAGESNVAQRKAPVDEEADKRRKPPLFLEDTTAMLERKESGGHRHLLSAESPGQSPFPLLSQDPVHWPIRLEAKDSSASSNRLLTARVDKSASMDYSDSDADTDAPTLEDAYEDYDTKHDIAQGIKVDEGQNGLLCCVPQQKKANDTGGGCIVS